MGCACFGFNEWWFEILLPCYWLEVVGLLSSDLWHHLVCKWSIYTHLFIYFSFVFGAGSYSNVRILISVCFPFTVRVALRDWIWADFGCMHEKSWSQFWKIQLLSDGFCFVFLIFTCISCWQWKREVFCLDVFTVYATDLEKLVISPQC